MDAFFTAILSSAAVGDRLDLRSMGLGRAMYYFATHAWGSQELGIALGAYSGASRSPIPAEADHRFRAKPITHSV